MGCAHYVRKLHANAHSAAQNGVRWHLSILSVWIRFPPEARRALPSGHPLVRLGEGHVCRRAQLLRDTGEVREMSAGSVFGRRDERI